MRKKESTATNLFSATTHMYKSHTCTHAFTISVCLSFEFSFLLRTSKDADFVIFHLDFDNSLLSYFPVPSPLSVIYKSYCY